MKRWTKNEDFRLKMLYPEHRSESIAIKLGRTRRAINSRALYLGVRKNTNFLKRQRRDMMRSLYEAGILKRKLPKATPKPQKGRICNVATPRVDTAALLAHRATLDCMPNPLKFLSL